MRVPWTAKRSNQSILKEISPDCSLEGLMLELKLQSFGHLMLRTDSFEKTLMLGKMETVHGVAKCLTTERLHFHFSLSYIGEGNGNPLHCFCLENPRDGGAWWAAVYGVAQSRTRLKRLSSSSSMTKHRKIHRILI